MLIEVWSDVTCPWCYIAHGRFEQVLDGFPHRDQIEVVQRSFELDPGRDPANVQPLADFLRERFGPAGAAMEERIAEQATHEGLAYRTDRHVGSTLDAHRLLHLAKDEGRQGEVLALLFDTNFGEAATIFTRDALVDLATRAGFAPGAARQVLDQPDAYLGAVRRDEEAAWKLGAQGVPFFVFDGRHTLTGAQPVAALRAMLDRAWAERSSTGHPAPPSLGVRP
ncbi:DsbA family oxidoreductase [Nitriliruptor alkaliphilus]|uniref:DsbA family oxidoreductase n=1 Tax=Nitriliruptor alkaliphilus TaxID=427918 RepID=UPI000696CB48|nr:DsbA family oxidoreductase [Nitriliruptor alkaliphilus]